MKFTQYHAQLIIENFEIDRIDEEEASLLSAHNPELYEAFKALVEFSNMDGGEG
jgi:hypothetical protein